MTNEERVPGSRLRRFAERKFDRETLDRILLPAIADLQHECAGAARGLPRFRAYWGVWKTIAICVVRDATRHASSVISSVATRMAIILPIVMCAALIPVALIPALNGATADGLSPGQFLLLSLPQMFALALPIAYFLAVSLERTAHPRRVLPAVLAMSLVCTLMMMAMTLSVMPRANQSYRQVVSDAINGGRTSADRSFRQVSFGTGEWTFLDLVRKSLGPTADRQTSIARTILNTRVANSTLPIVLGLLALGVAAGYAWHIAVLNGVWVLMFYVAVMRAVSSAHGPTAGRVWLVNGAFALAGLGLVLLRRESDQNDPPGRFYARA